MIELLPWSEGSFTRLFMRVDGPSGGVSLERLERALAKAALVVVMYGEVFAPILERLEREVEAVRRNDPVDRARRILES